MKKFPAKNSAFLIGLLLFLLSPLVFTQESKLVPFTLEDQFGRRFRDRDFQHWILVIIASDKDGSQYANIWGKAIRDALKNKEVYDKVLLVALSDLRGVPFFLKGWVKAKFPKERFKWVLLDWKGLFAEAYLFQPRATNILVFDCAGNLIHKTHGREIEGAKLDSIIQAIIEVMPDC